jgi:chromosome segregation ATPase
MSLGLTDGTTWQKGFLAMTDTVERLTSEITRLTAEVERLTGELTDAYTDLNSARQENGSFTAEFKRLTAEVERLHADVQTWQGHARTAIWSDSAECQMLAADNERLRAALAWIDQQRYTDRSTINPANGYDRAVALNEKLLAVMDAARAALTQEKPNDGS